MKGYEFVDKLLAGERDFSRVRLDGRYYLDQNQKFEELNKYLKGSDLKSNPVIIDHSDFRGLEVKGLHLPHLSAVNANFMHSKLWFANFYGANFENAHLLKSYLYHMDFRDANLTGAWLIGSQLSNSNFDGATLVEAKISGADLSYSNLNEANLRGSKLEGTNLEYASLKDTNLKEADLNRTQLEKAKLQGANLEGAIHLDQARDLDKAILLDTKVDEHNAEIIDRAFGLKYLIV